MKAFLQGTLKLAMAISLALIATVAVVAGGFKLYEDHQKDRDRAEAAPFETVSRRVVDLKNPLDLEFSIETKVVNGYLYVSVNADGYPQYLEHPANKAKGAFVLEFEDSDGFRINEKSIPLNNFTTLWGKERAGGLSYQYKEFISLSDYKRFNSVSIRWTVDPKLTLAKPQANNPKPSATHPDPCAPGLSKTERLSRLANFGQVRQTGSDTYSAGPRWITFIGNQLLSCN